MNKNQSINSEIKWFIFFVFAVTLAFGLGIVTNKFIELSASRGPISFDNNTSTVNINDIDTVYVQEILQKLNQEYLGEFPKSDELTYGVVKGIIESLDDKYTSFLDPKETENYLSSANNEFEGIGVTLTSEESYVVVETVLAGFPAERSGLKSGDFITHVNGESITGKTPQEAASLIRGEAGTEVKITLYRPSSGETLEKAIKREKIDLENMEWEMLDNGIAHIKIYRFSEDSVQNFNKNWDKIVKEVKEAGAKGIVLDLRNNPGGFVDSVKYVAEEFLKDDQIIFGEQYKSGNKVEAKDKRKGDFEDTPVVVLVNQGSASASEILAAAIQDNKRGEVIGTLTVGKGVEQKLLKLDDGSLLIVVFRKWLTPTGKNISADEPINPDVIIENSETEDLQLQKALELVKN